MVRASGVGWGGVGGKDGRGKSRWWWKSLNRRTKLAYWRREARRGY